MAAQSGVISGATAKTLTHEVGAGAPCLKCGDKCPGLDLHFWRKNCRNCRCKQEDHDVVSSVSTRGIDNIGKLLMQDRGETPKKTFTPKAESPSKAVPTTKKKAWVPPPAPKEEKQISTFKTTVGTPKADSTLPVNKPATFNVTVDIGGKKENLDFGIPASNESFPAPPPAINDLPSPPAATNDFPAPPPTSIETAADFPAPPQPNNEAPADFPAPPPPSSKSSAPPTETAPVVPPLPEEFQEKAQVSTDTPAPIAQSPVKVDNKFDRKSTSGDKEHDFDWAPPVQKKLMKDYIQSLPEEKRPLAGTDGAKYRKKQLMRQLPAHDQEPDQCHDLSPQEKEEMNAFVKKYREKALGVGNVEEGNKAMNCAECNEGLIIGEPIVWAERASEKKQWHPKCFVCHECKELLVDLIYFFNEDKIYCGRHYCELHKPRCAACDELIFAPEYTQAEDSFWHLKHFCCFHCDEPLGGQNYVPQDNQPVCIPCYEKAFANTCTTCKTIIAPNTEWVTFEAFHWHAQPECFKCSQCSESLVGKPCIPKEGMIFCSSKCKKEKVAATQ